MRSLICVGSATKLRPSIPTENPPPAMLVASHHRNDSYLSGGQRLIRRVRKISPTQSVQVQQMAPNSSIQTSSNYHQAPVKKGRTQCRELPHCAGSKERYQWRALLSPVQCEEAATQTQDLPITDGKTLPLAPGPRAFPYVL